MTTIAVAVNQETQKVEMVADSMATVGNTIVQEDCQKIANFGSVLVGGAGSLAEIKMFHDWIGQRLEAAEVQSLNPHVQVQMPEDLVADNFLGIVVYEELGETVALMYEGSSRCFEVSLPVAFGSGGDFALAALKAGATPEKSVEVAMSMDTHSGGEVVVEQFVEPPKEYSDEDIKAMSHEELLALVLGDQGEQKEEVQEVEEGVTAGATFNKIVKAFYHPLDEKLTVVFIGQRLYITDEEDSSIVYCGSGEQNIIDYLLEEIEDNAKQMVTDFLYTQRLDEVEVIEAHDFMLEVLPLGDTAIIVNGTTSDFFTIDWEENDLPFEEDLFTVGTEHWEEVFYGRDLIDNIRSNVEVSEETLNIVLDILTEQ